MQSKQDFWFKFLPGRALLGVWEVDSLSTRATAGASKIFAAAKWIAFLAVTLEEAPPDDENADSEGLVDPFGYRSLANAVGT